ncbi:MAG TPA: DUF222 domain-containing protein [Actinomycetota bacterium]|nr:DUF222 domain-containing protein [Actinomycetota bacterium]
MPPAEGAAVIAAVQRAETDEPDPATGAFDPPEVRAAEGLVALASTALREDADPDRACVVVHVSVEALVSGRGIGELESGGAIPASVVRRLACDGRIEAVLEMGGAIVHIGAARQAIPPHITRQLKYRDKTCRFPGCGARRHLHGHHLIHSADGGPTKVRNLALLCQRHHTLVHDGGWSVTGNPEPGPGARDQLQFLRPDGTLFVPHTPPGLPAVAGMDLMAALRSRE